MIAILDSLSGRARLAAASLVLGGFALVLVAPVFFGLTALAGAGQDYLAAREATAQIERRLTGFQSRRDTFQSERSMSDQAFDLYLDGAAHEAQFQARLQDLSEALRDAGIAVAGEDRILERQLSDGVVLLSADITVAGSLADLLTVLSAPQFASLRTEGAGFAAEAGEGQVRGALRFVSHHVESGNREGGDAD